MVLTSMQISCRALPTRSPYSQIGAGQSGDVLELYRRESTGATKIVLNPLEELNRGRLRITRVRIVSDSSRR